MKTAAFMLLLGVGTVHGQVLVGQSDPKVMVKRADVSGLPGVSFTDLFPFNVEAAARKFPGNTVYLANGAFTTQLYEWNGSGLPVATVQTQVAIQGLGYVRHGLFGFANFASPMGIYKIDPATGACTLVVDTSQQGYRFFGLDGSSEDGMLYGYTEYGGQTGLYQINPVTGEMWRFHADPAGGYGMCRGLAIGQGKAYLVATHPTDTFYAYGPAGSGTGQYTAFTNPYPASMNGGGAWMGPVFTCYADLNRDGILNLADFGAFQTVYAVGSPHADCNLDSVFNLADWGCYMTRYAVGCP